MHTAYQVGRCVTGPLYCGCYPSAGQLREDLLNLHIPSFLRRLAKAKYVESAVPIRSLILVANLRTEHCLTPQIPPRRASVYVFLCLTPICLLRYTLYTAGDHLAPT